jgi:hypothetical protein
VWCILSFVPGFCWWFWFVVGWVWVIGWWSVEGVIHGGRVVKVGSWWVNRWDILWFWHRYGLMTFLTTSKNYYYIHLFLSGFLPWGKIVSEASFSFIHGWLRGRVWAKRGRKLYFWDIKSIMFLPLTRENKLHILPWLIKLWTTRWARTIWRVIVCEPFCCS